ncbi:MAG TPA: hypothetical protein VEP90_27570 [Methylomirabilota bacterium]|nr:hypothetical protein [Methylomirabilota bacterium]
MPNKQQENQSIPGDLIGSKAKRLKISRNDGRAGCLCYVYALVLKEDIGSMLGAAEVQNNRLASNEPENKKAICSMIDALEEIHLKLSRFKANGNQENCPEKHRKSLTSDIDYLVSKLVLIIPSLETMRDIYDIAKRKQLPTDTEQFNRALNARNHYKSCLLKCRTHIVEINAQIKWWCEKLSPQSCLDQKAAG